MNESNMCVFVCLQDYWFSLVFKRLVGPRVLAVRVAGLQRKPQPGRVIRDKLRIYAHCTSYYKYVLYHQELVCNLSLNTVCVYIIDYELFISYIYIYVLLAFLWCIALLWECPLTFRLKADFCRFYLFQLSVSSRKHLRLSVCWGRTKSLAGPFGSP